MCPPERTALNEFYLSAKGMEWTERTLWQDPYASHCDWFGVNCSVTKNAIQLVLPNNGLSGKLSDEIATLTYLEVLDLSDNDIKVGFSLLSVTVGKHGSNEVSLSSHVNLTFFFQGSIPTAMADLTNLKYIRLCYNGFIGNETNFGISQQLELVQLHGNRLSGTIPNLNLLLSDPSSFISDCGNPSDFEEALVCEECTMCCE